MLCQASTICLNWEQWDRWLLTWGPVDNMQWTARVMVVKLSVWTPSMEGCPQVLGNRWWLRNILPVCFSGFMRMFSVFFVKWDLAVVLMCIFLMTNDAEHFFMYSLAICISSLEKCALNILSIFNQVVFLLLSCRSSLYILDTNPLSDKWSATKTPLLRHHQWAYPYLVTSCKSRTWILLDELLIFCSIRKRKTISNSSSVTELQKHDNFHVMSGLPAEVP